jgi:hypothetical protein
VVTDKPLPLRHGIPLFNPSLPLSEVLAITVEAERGYSDGVARERVREQVRRLTIITEREGKK